MSWRSITVQSETVAFKKHASIPVASEFPIEKKFRESVLIERLTFTEIPWLAARERQVRSAPRAEFRVAFLYPHRHGGSDALRARGISSRLISLLCRSRRSSRGSAVACTDGKNYRSSILIGKSKSSLSLESLFLSGAMNRKGRKFERVRGRKCQ